METTKSMTEQEFKIKYAEELHVDNPNDFDWTIRVTKNMSINGGNWHRYKFFLRKYWNRLNPGYEQIEGT